MPITEPRVWDAGTAQGAVKLSCPAGLSAAVEKVLVDSIVAVIDAVTRAGVFHGRRALPILGTRLYLALLIAAIGAVLVTITVPAEGHAEATGAALEFGGHTRVCSGSWGLNRGPGRNRSRGGLQAQPEAEQQPQCQVQGRGPL